MVESFHLSKWPFVIVYMDDIPRNAAGKPLRIKLASRLGLGRLEDSVPALHRHFEANTPHSEADPIAYSRVSVDIHDIEGSLFNIVGVEDIAICVRHNGLPDAFVSTRPAPKTCCDQQVRNDSIGCGVCVYYDWTAHLWVQIGRYASGQDEVPIGSWSASMTASPSPSRSASGSTSTSSLRSANVR